MNKPQKLASHIHAFQEILSLLTRHRQLTFEMAKREISDRYLGQFFGIFWAFGHPLIFIGIYVFIFAVVFKVKVGGTLDLPFDYTVYLMAGLIPWMGFQESMSKSSMVIVGNANLVKQVVFPIEILPVKGVISSLMTQIIFLVLLFIYVLCMYHTVPLTSLLVPILLLSQMLAMIGTSFILSSVGAYFRDMKDLIQVFSAVGVYLIPAFYLPDFVPALFRPFLYANPFSYFIWCYQDALYFGRIEHPLAWVIFPLLSVTVFYLGYRIFRKLKTMFGNVL